RRRGPPGRRRVRAAGTRPRRPWPRSRPATTAPARVGRAPPSSESRSLRGFGNRYARGWGTADARFLTTSPSGSGNSTLPGRAIPPQLTRLVVDSPSLFYRAFFALPKSIKGPDGNAVNAVRGYLDMVSRVLVDRRPGAVAHVFDADWRPQWRVDLY